MGVASAIMRSVAGEEPPWSARSAVSRLYLRWVRPGVSALAGFALFAIWLAYPHDGTLRAAVVAFLSSLVAIGVLLLARRIGDQPAIRLLVYVDIGIISIYAAQFDGVDVFGVTYLWAVVVAAAFGTPRDMVAVPSICVALSLVLPPLTRNADGAQVLVETLMLAVVGSMVAALGIDEHRSARERRSLQQQLQDAQRLAQIGSFDFDPATDVARWSGEMHRIFQVADGRPLGQDEFLEAVVEEDRERVAAQMAAGLTRGDRVTFDTTIRRGDGELRKVHVIGTPMGTGDQLRIVGTVQDVTELRVLDDLRDEFVAAASHELRTPTSIVLGFASTLTHQWEQLPDSDRRKFASEIEGAAERLSMLIQDVLQVTQIESGNVRALRERFDVRAEVAALVRSWPGETRVVLDGDGDGDGDGVRAGDAAPIALGDAVRTRQIVSNLLDNAERHGAGATKPVHVRIEHVDGEVRVQVADHGPGVPDDQHERIFDRFVRLERDSTGTGLGLYISRRLAEAQGGTLRVDATPGGGATFTFALPADAGRLEP